MSTSTVGRCVRVLSVFGVFQRGQLARPLLVGERGVRENRPNGAQNSPASDGRACVRVACFFVKKDHKARPLSGGVSVYFLFLVCFKGDQ